MNHAENNMIRCLKTTVFMIACLLVFSALTYGDSRKDSIHGSILTSEVLQIHNHAIIIPVSDGVTLNHPVSNPGYQNLVILNYKLAFDSRLFNQRFISLRKCRESISPLHNFNNFLPVIRANPDDLPDLS